MTEQNKLPISAIILTYNEEANIEDCLKSVHDWVGEVLVVDSGSTDETLDIVQRYTSLIYEHSFENYSRQRNWAQAKLPLAYEWVFHLDADERVTPELAHRIADVFRSDLHEHVDGFLVRRRTIFMGRWIRHGGVYPTHHLRLFRRSKGRCEEREYDQHFLVDGPLTRLDADLIDITAPDLATWTERHNRWASAEARHLLAHRSGSMDGLVKGSLTGSPIERRRWLRTHLYEGCPLFLRAFVYFVYRYFFRLGFLDGVEGLIYHVLQGFWYRFYVDAITWQRGKHAAN